MSWQLNLWLLLGGTTVLLFLGLPVAYTFFGINIVGALLFLGADAGLTQLARNGVVAVIPYVGFSMLLLAAIFFFPAIAIWFPNALIRLTGAAGAASRPRRICASYRLLARKAVPCRH